MKAMAPITKGPLFDGPPAACADRPEVDVASIPPLPVSQAWAKWPAAWDIDEYLAEHQREEGPNRTAEACAAKRRTLTRRCDLMGWLWLHEVGGFFAPVYWDLLPEGDPRKRCANCGGKVDPRPDGCKPPKDYCCDTPEPVTESDP